MSKQVSELAEQHLPISARKYLEILKINFKGQLVYRFDVFVSVVFTITKIVFAYILWEAIFSQNEIVGGFTFYSMLSYYIVSAFLSGLDKSQKTSEDICNQVIQGTFSKYMVIPVNVQGYFLAQTFGRAAFYLVFHLLASLVWIFVFRIDFVFTTDPYQILIAFIMLLLGLVFMIQLHFFIGILSFKFLSIGLFKMIVDNIVEFATGTFVPLVLLPDIVISVMRFLPFYYVTYLPSMLLIGRNGNEGISGLIIILIWVLFFFVLNKVMYKRIRTLFEGVGI